MALESSVGRKEDLVPKSITTLDDSTNALTMCLTFVVLYLYYMTLLPLLASPVPRGRLF